MSATHALWRGSTMCGVPWSSIGDPRSHWIDADNPYAKLHVTCEHCLAAMPGAKPELDARQAFRKLQAKAGVR